MKISKSFAKGYVKGWIYGTIVGLIIIFVLIATGVADTIQEKYAQSLTREIRKDEQIKFLVKENNENGFWKFCYQIGTTVFAVLWITK